MSLMMRRRSDFEADEEEGDDQQKKAAGKIVQLVQLVPVPYSFYFFLISFKNCSSTYFLMGALFLLDVFTFKIDNICHLYGEFLVYTTWNYLQ